MNPSVSDDRIRAPTTDLSTYPDPPNSEVPPRIAAASTGSSSLTSVVGSTAPNLPAYISPASAALALVRMNAPILYRPTLMPDSLDASLLPPTA